MSKRKSRGCLGCTVSVLLVLLLVLALLLLWTWAVRSGLLVRLGLRQSAAQQVLRPTPNLELQGKLRTALQEAGIPSEAVTIYVYPLKNQSGNALVAVIDSQKLTNLMGADSLDELGNAIEPLFAGDLGDQLQIERIGFDYRTASGRSLVRATFSRDAVRRLAAGEITDVDELRREVIWLVDPVAAAQEGWR